MGWDGSHARIPLPIIHSGAHTCLLRCLSERAAMSAGYPSLSSNECSFTLEAKLSDFTSRLLTRQETLAAAQ